ncbi:MAG: diphthine--ammonia ligase [Candidatus Poseidoniaceae archaeon]|nr:diphthine--ammonia ligase [Candidatus Poseidoniaceae archaeon]
MRIAVLSSGGKDSSAAWWWAMCRGWDVVAIVTVEIQDGDSHMFQVPSTKWVKHQAQLAEIPWINVPASGSVEDEIQALESALSQLEIDALVSGALRSDFQKQRLECMCQRLNIHSYAPLWHQTPIEHLRGMVEAGFEIMLTSVSCEGLDHTWLGHVLTKATLDELHNLSLQHRFNVDGEGGEYETFVLGGPIWSRSLQVSGEEHHTASRGVFTIQSVV